ncbi:MAG: autotransporter-associated beta strand repeat-containing protein, partial [Akkermansia sp.]|nr:autotransporter-associated beta strand repeat-containing protein [Akkermansia sp.]
GNASVGVMNHEVLHMSNYEQREITLDLKGYTFTKQGLGSFVARNVTMSESGGTILVHQGDFYIDKGSLSRETDIVMAAETSLHMSSVNSENAVEGASAPAIRSLSGSGSVILNDAVLTLHTTIDSAYNANYMDKTQSFNQFLDTTGFGYAVFSGTISEGSDASSLVKAGDGVHYLSGSANTYSGGTRIDDGRLYLLGTSTQSGFVKGGADVAFGVAGTGAIIWAGANAELYLGHDTRIYNEGSVNVAGGVMTIGVEGAPNNVLEKFAREIKDSEGNVVMVEIETHNLKSIAVDAVYADGTKYEAGTEIDRNKMLLVMKSNWEAAKNTKVTGFSDAGYNEAVYSGVLSGDASLHKVGVGTLVLDQSNTYTGGTEVDAGTLRVRGWGSLGKSEKTNAVNVHDGATLMFTHNTGYGNEPTSAANDITLVGNGDARWAEHAATDNGTAALISAVGPAVTFVLSGDITGSGNVRHSGEGVLVLSGDNAYTGDTYVSRGTVEVQSATGLGATENGQGAVTIEHDADLRVTVEEGYTEDRMVTTLAADSNEILGDIFINGTSETERILRMAGNGYESLSTTLNENGTLLLNGEARDGVAVKAESAMLTGSGKVVVSDATASGASMVFDSMIDYTGDFRVEGDKASISVTSGTFIDGSIYVAGQQASVSIGSDIFIADGESLHLTSTGDA